MSGNKHCTLFIGNLDCKVDERMLYEILIQAGPLVDLYIPRDKETNRHKGYAFAEYEDEGVARYAVDLFSGFLSLYNKKVRFEISGENEVSPTRRARGSSSRLIEKLPDSAPTRLPPSCRMSSQRYPYSSSNHRSTEYNRKEDFKRWL